MTGVNHPMPAQNTPFEDEEVARLDETNQGLGCGDTLAFTQLASGMTVVDLGSGEGFAALVASNRVGLTGHVIGVDMRDDMLALARDNARKRGAHNVEFRKGFIESLPINSNSTDFVISNWAINLSADKPAVFREIARVLKPGSRFAISDIVLLKPLPLEVARETSAYVGCIATASLLTDYLCIALAAGLRELTIPHIAHGPDFVKVLTPEFPGISPTPLKLPGAWTRWPAEALASIQLQGKK
jgi:SAM-dependent methyltransferase